MLNPERLLGQLLMGGLGARRGRRRRRSGLLGGLSTGAKAQIGMGLLGVAIAAYEHYTNKGQSLSSPASSGSGPEPPRPVPPMPRSSLPAPNPEDEGAKATDAILLVQAMVAAAAADGLIDATERAQILHRADQAGFDAETKAFLEKEMASPKSLAVIVASARPEMAVDLYAASCAAIDADTEAEKTYLDALATHLKLSRETRDEIHRNLEMV